ncbi:hypothetical protein T4E_205 [Trichinella pseudospiralis]|uniref:Uncharacterized protein n=1 Tax=Trichinella pseudospiralis TaxID=6337 RepID=A0A0V0XX91_TRIPS|nr:hypothetical protein T4E_205 [Trichinella pseudospiralis]
MYNLYRPPSQGVFGGPGTQHSHLPNSSVPSGAATGFAMKPDCKSKWLSFVGKQADIWALVIYCSTDSGCQRWTGVRHAKLER